MQTLNTKMQKMKNLIYILYVQSVYTGLLQAFFAHEKTNKKPTIVS